MKQFIVAFLIAIFIFSCTTENTKIQPVDLRTEYLDNPIGIGVESPKLTWRFEGESPDLTISKVEIKIWEDTERKGQTIQIKQEATQEGILINSVVISDQLKSHTRYCWSVTAWDGQGAKCRTSETAFFETAMLSEKDWKAKWITDGYKKEDEPAPLFRKQVTITGKPILSARAYISAAGYYQMYINGTGVGEDRLNPGFTNYNKRILYVTHDITGLLKEGNNILAAELGNSWYNVQSAAAWNYHKADWRNRPCLLAEFHINYTDGSKEIICTDNTWKTSTGANIYNNIYSGDNVDLRLEEKGWKTVDFDDSKWVQSNEVPSPSPLLLAQQMPGIRVSEVLKPSELNKINDKLYIFKFPKNIAGLSSLKVKGEAGTIIKMTHSELLKENGRLELQNISHHFHSEKEGEVFQQDIIILRDSDEWVEFTPSFTYHGFQYVEIESSKPIELTKESLTALFFHTDVKSVGSFECSNQTLNKIWEATRHSYLSNLHGIPTDCPQREKNGWTADAHFAIDLALLNYDGITVYEKWMNDVIDSQYDNGEISGVIPSYNWGYGTGPVWDAVLFIIPDALYQYYGDSRCIEKMIPTLDRYLAYLESREEDGLIKYGLGDWVPYKSKTNNAYTSTAYYYLDYKLRASFARILGEDDSRFIAKMEEIRKNINEYFFDEETNTYAEGTQTAQALALYLGLVSKEKEKKVAEKLHELVVANNYFLDFGVIGSKVVPRMLTEYGYVEDAMKMATKTEIPSWGYWVDKMGYSALAEEWIINPSGTSLNHVFLGDISAWMINKLAGINYDSQNPGFKHILITPHFVNDLSWVKGEYNSIKGLIKSEWKRENNKIILKVTIPVGCKASIIIEGKDTVEIGSGNHQFEF